MEDYTLVQTPLSGILTEPTRQQQEKYRKLKIVIRFEAGGWDTKNGSEIATGAPEDPQFQTGPYYKISVLR